jgi:hypothetical protein
VAARRRRFRHAAHNIQQHRFAEIAEKAVEMIVADAKTA